MKAPTYAEIRQLRKKVRELQKSGKLPTCLGCGGGILGGDGRRVYVHESPKPGRRLYVPIGTICNDCLALVREA